MPEKYNSRGFLHSISNGLDGVNSNSIEADCGFAINVCVLYLVKRHNAWILSNAT